jgi:hypothetical protein
MVSKVLDWLVHFNAGGGGCSVQALPTTAHSYRLLHHSTLDSVWLAYTRVVPLDWIILWQILDWKPITRWHQSLSFGDEIWGQMDMHVLICIFYVVCAKNAQKWITMLWRLQLLVTLFSGPKYCSASYFRNSPKLSLQNSTSCLQMNFYFVREFNNLE